MDPEAYVDPAAQAVGLTLHPDHRPGVVTYLALAATMAERVMSFPLGTEDEGANTFRPVPLSATEERDA
jgi:hypothetical protein